MDLSNIKKLSKNFTSEKNELENPAGLCFATSFPLLIYLATKQIKSRLRVGRVPTIKDGKPLKVPHYWLQVDSEGTMVDPTIRQFDENEEPIYFGKLGDNKTTKKYRMKSYHQDMWFPTAYFTWKIQFEDPNYPRDNELVQKNITFTIKLATTLHTEIKSMSSQNDFIKHCFGLYFTPIYIFLNQWYSDKKHFENLKEQMPKEFNDLLSDALLWANSGQY